MEETNGMNTGNNTQSDGNKSEQNVSTGTKSAAGEKTYTLEEVNKWLAKEKGTGEKQILSMFGLNSKDEVPGFIAEHQNLKTQHETAKAELNKVKNQSLLASKGVQADFMDYVMYEVSKLADDKNGKYADDFNTAADKFLESKPIYKGSGMTTSGMTVSFGAGQDGGAAQKTSNEIMNDLIRKK